jgi:hypothetical protein
VLISNAYVIPDATFMDDLRTLAARGVRVRILTNSLSSNDVPAVNAHYGPWRRRLLETGVTLHELRADAAIQAELVDTPPVRSGFVGLHVKAMVVDRQRSFIGSMNLDPRSEVFNSEMGVVVDSPPLAGEPVSGRHAGVDQRRWRAPSAARAWLHAAGREPVLQTHAGELLLITMAIPTAGHHTTRTAGAHALAWGAILVVAMALAGCAGFVPQEGPPPEPTSLRGKLPDADHALRRRGRLAGAPVHRPSAA